MKRREGKIKINIFSPFFLVQKNGNRYLPVVYVDELNLRLRDLVVVNATDEKGSVTFK